MNTEEIWNHVSGAQKIEFLTEGGRMAEAILAFDWAGTSIGPIHAWPRALKSAVQMAVSSRQAICMFWGRDLNMIYNDAYAPILGEKEAGALGQPAQVIWSDVWNDIAPIIREALSGKGTWGEDLPLLMTRNGYEEQTYWSFSYSPIYSDDGTVGGMINITTETTSSVENKAKLNQNVIEASEQSERQARLDAQQRVIQREMAHRIKNILSMTLAVVSQTMRHAVSLEEATDALVKRISALSNAQDVLTNARFEEADIHSIIGQVLAPHVSAEGRINLSGPSAMVPAPAALGMALAVHELATNAAKYGALSNDSGSVSLRWAVTENGAFQMEWLEAGGPEVSAPTRSGFGSRLMKRIVPGYFAGTGESFYDPTGFRYVLSGTLAVSEFDEMKTASRSS